MKYLDLVINVYQDGLHHLFIDRVIPFSALFALDAAILTHPLYESRRNMKRVLYHKSIHWKKYEKTRF